MLTIVSNEFRKAHLRATMSSATTLGEKVGSVGSGLQGLRADQSLVVEKPTSAAWNLEVLRPEFGWI